MTLQRNLQRLLRAAALATALALASACSNGGSDDGSDPPPAPVTDLPSDDPADPTLDDTEDGASGALTTAPEEPLDRSACEILLPEDIAQMTQFPGTTFTIVDRLDEPPDPDDVIRAHSSRCGFNVETATSGGTGPWVFVTLTNDVRAFAPDPTWPEYEAVDGVGDDAYWTDGGFTLVILLDDHVVEIESSVSPDGIDDEIEGRQQLVLALADVVLPRV
jgi:hypothetical protein